MAFSGNVQRQSGTASGAVAMGCNSKSAFRQYDIKKSLCVYVFLGFEQRDSWVCLTSERASTALQPGAKDQTRIDSCEEFRARWLYQETYLALIVT
jgi:hypothetical protein